MPLSSNLCFLCGQPLQNEDCAEHVFPKWLQNRYDLWDKRLTLLNRTSIQYRQLTISCCHFCNNNSLSKLENVIKSAIGNGYSSVKKLSKKRIYQWISKIYYGILIRELSLSLDQRYPEKGPIVPPVLLMQYKLHHYFLQSIRFPFIFHSFHPWSIFLVQIYRYDDDRDFDYHDSLFGLTFSIRLNGIGIIVRLQDNGLQELNYANYFKRFRGHKLHPAQFDELASKVAYKSLLETFTTKYLFKLPGKGKKAIEVFALPPTLSSDSLYSEWDHPTYARLLSSYWDKYGIKYEDIYKEPNRTLSILFKEDGNFMRFNPDDL